ISRALRWVIAAAFGSFQPSGWFFSGVLLLVLFASAEGGVNACRHKRHPVGWAFYKRGLAFAKISAR
ncbi:MAG: hypothetical protein J4G05_05585, partial [Chlorobi bacterium]|nr:hypothetical protein [Chlorobiota bacterium]